MIAASSGETAVEQFEVAPDVLLEPLGILLVMGAPQLEQPVAEAERAICVLHSEDKTIGYVDQLPRIVLLKSPSSSESLSESNAGILPRSVVT